MKRKIHNNTGLAIKEGRPLHVDGCRIKDVDTSKFKEGDKLYLSVDKPRKKQNMIADIIAAGVMLLGQFTMLYFWEGFAANMSYNIILFIFAFAAWFFLGRVLIYKIKNDE